MNGNPYHGKEIYTVQNFLIEFTLFSVITSGAMAMLFLVEKKIINYIAGFGILLFLIFWAYYFTETDIIEN